VKFKRFLRALTVFLLSFLIFASQVIADPAPKTKFYNFDDLLINGKIKKPQILYIDKKQKVKFERLLKLKKEFLPNITQTKKDPSLR